MAVAGALSAGAARVPQSEGTNVSSDDLDFQTLRIAPAADTTINSWFSGANFGSDWTVTVRSSDIAAPLFKFDLSGIPYSTEEVLVAEATLNLRVKSRTNQSTMLAAACAISRPWASGETTWVDADLSSLWSEPGCNGPEDRAQDCSPVVQLDQVDAWMSFDVTEAVRSWLSGDSVNNGLIVKSRSGGSVSYSFISSDDENNAPLRPFLKIVFAVVPTPTATLTPTNTPTLTHTPTPTHTTTPTSTPTPKPRLLVHKTGPSGPLQIGEHYAIGYDISVSNPGPHPLSRVILTDLLPLGTEFLGTTSGGVFDPEDHIVTWSLGWLDPGETRVVNLDLELPTWVREEGIIVNLARAECAECLQVHEDYWEIPVILPVPSPTPRIATFLVPVHKWYTTGP